MDFSTMEEKHIRQVKNKILRSIEKNICFYEEVPNYLLDNPFNKAKYNTLNVIIACFFNNESKINTNLAFNIKKFPVSIDYNTLQLISSKTIFIGENKVIEDNSKMQQNDEDKTKIDPTILTDPTYRIKKHMQYLLENTTLIEKLGENSKTAVKEMIKQFIASNINYRVNSYAMQIMEKMILNYIEHADENLKLKDLFIKLQSMQKENQQAVTDINNALQNNDKKRSIYMILY